MTQYSPYQPPYPSYGYPTPASDPGAAPRRAGIMMYIAGALVTLLGFCCVGVGALLPDILAQQPQLSEQFSQIPNFTPKLFQAVMVVAGAMSALLGIVLIVLGRFIGKGSKVATILASC